LSEESPVNDHRGRAGVVGAVLVLGGLTLAGTWTLEPALADSKVDPPSRNKAHYIANAGTGFAVLALKACDPAAASPEEGRPQ
jgi:hypothetical protein